MLHAPEIFQFNPSNHGVRSYNIIQQTFISCNCLGIKNLCSNKATYHISSEQPNMFWRMCNNFDGQQSFQIYSLKACLGLDRKMINLY